MYNALTPSISNGIESELGCSSTSVFTKTKISPLEQTQKSNMSSKLKQNTPHFPLQQLLDFCSGDNVGDIILKCRAYLSRHNPAPQ